MVNYYIVLLSSPRSELLLYYTITYRCLSNIEYDRAKYVYPPSTPMLEEHGNTHHGTREVAKEIARREGFLLCFSLAALGPGQFSRNHGLVVETSKPS